MSSSSQYGTTGSDSWMTKVTQRFGKAYRRATPKRSRSMKNRIRSVESDVHAAPEAAVAFISAAQFMRKQICPSVSA